MRHNLYMFRCDKKLSQAEMASMLGVCRTTYSLIEKGKRSGTSDFWAKLQAIFNIPDEQMYKLMKLEDKE